VTQPNPTNSITSAAGVVAGAPGVGVTVQNIGYSAVKCIGNSAVAEFPPPTTPIIRTGNLPPLVMHCRGGSAGLGGIGGRPAAKDGT
jgi:hypothetical protein